MKMGLGHGDRDIGMCGQGLGTQGCEMRDVRMIYGMWGHKQEL